MALKNEALRQYAETLQQAGFAIYEPTGLAARHFVYSRIVDDVECFGIVGERDFGGYRHLMPIWPSREHGSSMHVDNVSNELTVQVARKIASPKNWNDVVGTHANHWGRHNANTYEKWDVLPTPAFVKADRVEYGAAGAPWRGIIVDVRGDYVDVQWDHDVAIDVAIDVTPKLGRTLRVVE